MQEETKEICEYIWRLSEGCLMHLIRNIISWTSNQYIRGRRLSEVSLDL